MAMKHIASDTSSSNLTDIQEGDVQPNAVDLRLDKVFMITKDIFIIDEDKKQHRSKIEVKPSYDGYYYLDPGHYEVVMQNKIEVGEDEAGFVITRSTLNRNGVHLTTGLYDTGYKGVMAAVMHVNCGPMKIKPGTRVGQYLCFESQALHNYEGDYGDGSEHDVVYETDKAAGKEDKKAEKEAEKAEREAEREARKAEKGKLSPPPPPPPAPPAPPAPPIAEEPVEPEVEPVEVVAPEVVEPEVVDPPKE